MEHDQALLDGLAELRAAHDKASRLMAEITALGARALKGRGVAPSVQQLQSYRQALAQAQRHAAHCEELLLGGRSPSLPGPTPGSRPYVH